MQSPPFPRYLVPSRSKYSPQHHVLKHPQLPFLPQCQRPSFTPIQDALISQIHFWNKTPHVSDCSSGVFHCTHNKGICHTGFPDILCPSWSCWQAVSKPVWHTIAVCTVKSSGDGQRNSPKHVEFYSKKKFGKLVQLVGFIIRICHEARSPGRQIASFVFFACEHAYRFSWTEVPGCWGPQCGTPWSHCFGAKDLKVVDSSWNVMAHGDALERKWRGNWRMEWLATLHTTSEHGVSSITTADAHTSAASNRLNWRLHRFGLVRFAERRNRVFCACAVTFQTRTFMGDFRTAVLCSVQRTRARYWRYSTYWYQGSRRDWKWQTMFGVIEVLLLKKLR